MKIRSAQKKDISACLSLHKEKYWKSKDFEEAIKKRDVVFLVAEERKIVGYVLGFVVPTKRNEAMLHETRVHTKERNKGIGTKLVNECCKRLFKKGVNEIYAEIDKEHLPFYRDACKFSVSGKWVEVKRKN